MKKRNLAPKEKNERIRRERDPIPWRYCLLTLVCGLLLVVGFFWAARQHFSAMDFGIKNAKLRQQKESLEADQRRLYITKEISLSPAEIKKVAKKIGLQDLTAESIEVISPTRNLQNAQTEKPINEKVKQPLIEKTAKVEKNETLKKTETPKTVEKNKQGKEKSQILPATNSRQQIAKK